MQVSAIVLAAGMGMRMGGQVNKHLLCLGGRPVIVRTLEAFQRCPDVHSIVLVAGNERLQPYRSLVEQHDLTKVSSVVLGGETRQESCARGLAAVTVADIVLVHDGARPLVSERVIAEVIRQAYEQGAAVAAVPAKDTIKLAREDGFVLDSLPRERLWQMQTPQGFRTDIFRQAHEAARRDHFLGTDDAMLVERLGYAVKLVESDYANIKITTAEDVLIAEALWQARHAIGQTTPAKGQAPRAEETEAVFRMGIGQDSHAFVPQGTAKPLVLAGVLLPGEPGLSANSDGDVVFHALFNALSSAVGQRSLGIYADPLCRQGITNSAEYVRVALRMVREEGYAIGNVSVCIEAKRPRIEPLVASMRESIASLLGVTPDRIGITATSGEGLTAFGRGEGIQALAVVSLVPIRAQHVGPPAE